MRRPLVVPILLAALAAAACGGKTDAPAAAAKPAEPTLTPWEQEHGVGPVTMPVVLATGTHEAKEGEALFAQRCASCHKPNERYVGPALGGVVARRNPEYVMNMILAPDQMVAKHPEAKKLFGTYLIQMPAQGLTTEQAREVMEYLRTLPAPPAQ